MDMPNEQLGETPEQNAAEEMESSDKKIRASGGEQSLSAEKQDLNQTAQLTTQEAAPARIRKGGGPRTTQGKQKSKYNALKHGIFSQVVLLKREPRAEFDSLQSKLRDDLEPKGILEELLVDKLAVLVWRHRRLIIAEGAEIRKGTEFLEWEEKRRQHHEAANITVLDVRYRGLVREIANPKILDKCVNLLERLYEGIEFNGFEEEEDKAILGQLYGDPESKLGIERSLFDTYSDFLGMSRYIASSDDQIQILSPEQCKSIVLDNVKKEIKRLKCYKVEQATIESNRMKVESLRANVPDAPQLDRLLKSETNLERAFERTLNQLERLQRIRKGQPVPPALNVNVST